MTSPATVGPDGSAARRLNRRGAARRAGLIQHAVALIADAGVDHVRVVDVCQAAGVPNSGFYWYFRDLDDLMAQAIIDARRVIRHTVGAAIAAIESPLARLYVSARDSALLAFENETLRVLTVGEIEAASSGDHAEEIRKSHEVFIHDTVVMLSEGQVWGLVRNDRPTHHLAHCIRSTVHHTVVSYHRGLLHGEPMALADAVASFAIRGVCMDLRQAQEVEETWSVRPSG